MKILNIRTTILSTALLAGLSLVGCSEINEILDTQSVGTKPTKVLQTPAYNSTTQKIEMTGLLGWFEKSCGSTQAHYTEGTAEYKSKRQYRDFQESFMGKKYDADYNYTPFVKSDFRSYIPSEYSQAIKNISVTQDADYGIHYYVNFQDATYRGHDLSKLEIFYMPESDYSYEVLHFANDDFMQLQPTFTSLVDDLDITRGGHFDAKNKTVTCDLGM